MKFFTVGQHHGPTFRTLEELMMLTGETSAPKEIGRAMAEIDVALITKCPFAAASRCTIAAARLIRAAELFQQNAPGLEQVAEGAGSEAATPSAAPSPSAANHRPQPMFITAIGGGAQ